jgi:hypothetical protein
MIKEHDLVVLKHDISDHELRGGDIGTIVHCYEAGDFEVEFVSAGGHTVAVLSLSRNDLREMGASEILHVRDLAAI